MESPFFIEVKETAAAMATQIQFRMEGGGGGGGGGGGEEGRGKSRERVSSLRFLDEKKSVFVLLLSYNYALTFSLATEHCMVFRRSS